MEVQEGWEGKGVKRAGEREGGEGKEVVGKGRGVEGYPPLNENQIHGYGDRT